MRRWTGIVGAIALVTAACSGSPTADTTTTTPPTTVATTAAPIDLTVTASDGSASLLVPASSAGEAITIVPDPSTVTGPAVDALVAAGYEAGPAYLLGPEGLTFSEPLVLQIPAPDDGRLVAAFLVGDGTLEPLELADGDDTAEVGFIVPHFSQVVAFFGPFSASLTVPPQAEVGVPFTVRSQIYQQSEAFPSAGFRVSGHLIGILRVRPARTAAPPLTDYALPVFTSVYSLTCTEVGDADINHYLGASVLSTELTPDAAALYPSVGGRVIMGGRVKTQVECVAADTVDLDTGVFSGSLQITGIPGWPGGSYSDTFTLELRACGDAVLTQRADQVTLGRFYKVIGPPQVDSFFYYVHTEAEKDEYGEAYEVRVQVTGEAAHVSGVTAGGGHGFGSKLTALEAAAVAIWADLGHEPLDSVDVGWASAVEGTLERTGDAEPCE